MRFLTQVTLYTRELGVAFGHSSFDTVDSHDAHGPQNLAQHLELEGVLIQG